MCDIHTIQNRIGERIFCKNSYPIQKFVDKCKYKTLLDTNSLYIASADRLSDAEEGYLFLQNSIENIKIITSKNKDKCRFISVDGIDSPYERCKILLEQVFKFNNPRYMIIKEQGCFIRPEYDIINGYNGLRYEDAVNIYENDLPILRSNTYITCFCCNMNITECMKVYGDIIIVTTKERLINSIESNIPGLEFRTFPVMYLEKNNSYDLQFYQNTIYEYNVFGVKRTEYIEEEEFRVQFSRKEPSSMCLNHITPKIDLNILIEKIIATTQDAYDYVTNLNIRKGLNIDVINSSKSRSDLKK